MVHHIDSDLDDNLDLLVQVLNCYFAHPHLINLDYFVVLVWLQFYQVFVYVILHLQRYLPHYHHHLLHHHPHHLHYHHHRHHHRRHHFHQHYLLRHHLVVYLDQMHVLSLSLYHGHANNHEYLHLL